MPQPVVIMHGEIVQAHVAWKPCKSPKPRLEHCLLLPYLVVLKHFGWTDLKEVEEANPSLWALHVSCARAHSSEDLEHNWRASQAGTAAGTLDLYVWMQYFEASDQNWSMNKYSHGDETVPHLPQHLHICIYRGTDMNWCIVISRRHEE